MISKTLKQGLFASLGLGLCLTNVTQSVQAVTPTEKRDPQMRIVNGERAKKDQYPFMTALVERGSSEPFCGGSYIGKRYILTASHCVEDLHVDQLAVVVSEYDTESKEDGQLINVAQVYLHEGYDSTSFNNDVAILELESDVKGVEPIALMTPKMEQQWLKTGEMLTVAGWGNLKADEQKYPRYLQHVQVPLYDRKACNTEYDGITEQMVCAGFEQGGKDSCSGDSGGPLMWKRNGKWYQVGVVSFGDECAKANAPGVYARASQYLSWVAQKKAGVSYQQITDQGYVELEYKDKPRFEIKNVGQTPFQVTAVEFNNQVGVKNLAVENDECNGKQLSNGQSCGFQVNLVADGVSKVGVDMLVRTDHPQNNQALHRIRMNVLDKAELDVPKIVGSNNNFIKWYAGGDVPWVSQTRHVAKGDSALESGSITHQQNSVLLAVVDKERVSELGFKYLVSSEDGYDGLVVNLNGRAQGFFASGTKESEFKAKQITLGKGTDRIAFVYRKDQSDEGEVGDDRAYLDEITTKLANKAPKVVLKPVNVTVEEMKSVSLNAADSTDPDGDKLTYKWEIVGKSLAGKLTDGKDGKALFKAGRQAGVLTYKVTVTDAYGKFATATGKITVNKKRRSGGSLSWALVMFLLLVLIHRRSQ